MTFGALWDAHIHLDEVKGWYKKLVPGLQQEIDAYQPNPEDEKPIANFTGLMGKVVKFTDNSVGGVNTLPAHNPKLHFGEVHDDALVLFDAHYGSAGQKGHLLLVRQMLAIAAYSHDWGHRGCTLLVDHQKSKHGRKLRLTKYHNANETLEHASAWAVNDFLKKEGVSLPARVFVVGVILATTFGHKDAVARGLNFVPNPEPKTFCHALIRVADAHAKQKFEDEIDYGVRVVFGEVPASAKRPGTTREFISAQRGFMNYRINGQDILVCIAGKDICRSFRATVREHIARLDKILAGEDPKGYAICEAAVNKWNT